MYWTQLALWIIGGCAAIATPAYVLYQLIRKGLRALGNLETAGHELNLAGIQAARAADRRRESQSPRYPGCVGGEEGIESAYKERERIRRARKLRKDRRLALTLERWRRLKLVK